MRNNYKIYFSIIVSTSILTATFIKFFFRTAYQGSNQFIILLLGSSPSFFYAIGISFIFPLFKEVISFKQFVNYIIFITLGSILYETEQLWTNRTFDYVDIIASVIGAVSSLIFYKIIYMNRSTSKNF